MDEDTSEANSALVKRCGEEVFDQYMQILLSNVSNYVRIAPCFKCGKQNGKEAGYGVVFFNQRMTQLNICITHSIICHYVPNIRSV